MLRIRWTVSSDYATMVEVKALIQPELLIEIEAMAIIEGS
jgi:enamine deaminase RidA (YjgF/YER057c/UK114 family)